MSIRRCACVLSLVGLWGCADDPVALTVPEPSFAKAPLAQRVDFTIGGAGMSLIGDGKGTYVDGWCGVWGTWTSDITHLAPAEAKIPRSQQASCVGIAPRAATLTLAVRHVSDVPHVDDDQSPGGSGSFTVQNVSFGWGSAQVTKINASNGASPACGTVGLRFTSVTYPGTDNVVREDLGGGLWRMYTRPWPDNRAYCEIGGAATYWHVSMDVTVQVR